METEERENLVYHRNGPIGTIELSSTSRFNALNPDLMEALNEVLAGAEDRGDLRCLVVRGTGEAFCAGADLQRLRDPDRAVERLDRLVAALHEVILALVRMDCPVLMGVNGTAAGAGFSLALCGDYVLMDRSARLDYAYGRLGLTGDGGCTYFLPRLVGLRRAQRIVLQSSSFDAPEAESLGLVTEVVSSGAFGDRLDDRARALAAGPTAALGRSRRLLHEAAGPPLEEHLEAERRAMVEAVQTEDFRRGLQAFFEGRNPEFTGH